MSINITQVLLGLDFTFTHTSSKALSDEWIYSLLAYLGHEFETCKVLKIFFKNCN